MCTATFRYIDLGDTFDQVTQACGKPTSASTKQIPAVTKTPTEQWIYDGNGANQGEPISGSYTLPYNLEHDLMRAPKLTITFAHDKVTSVTLDSQEVGATSLCDNSPVNKGDSMDTVQSLCGTPIFRNTGSQQTFSGLVELTIWTYQRGPDQAPLVLQFEEGKLTKILQ